MTEQAKRELLSSLEKSIGSEMYGTIETVPHINDADYEDGYTEGYKYGYNSGCIKTIHLLKEILKDS